MGVFEMIVAVVAISVIGGILNQLIRKKAPSNGELIELKKRIEKLESEKLHNIEIRLQTIEAILTDSKEELKREIDAL